MTTTTPLRFDEAARTRLRRKLMARGRKVSEDLATLLAGGPAAEAVISRLGPLPPGKRPEDILRASLAQVETLRKLIDADDDAYGRCWQCGEDLGLAKLDEVPWADACGKHAGSV